MINRGQLANTLRVVSAFTGSCVNIKKGDKLLSQITPLQLIIPTIGLIIGKDNSSNIAVTAIFHEGINEWLMPMMLMCAYRAYGEQACLLDRHFHDMEIYLLMTSMARFGSKQDALL